MELQEIEEKSCENSAVLTKHWFEAATAVDQQIHWKKSQIHWITNMKKRRDIIQFEIIIIAVFTMEPKYFESRVYVIFFSKHTKFK